MQTLIKQGIKINIIGEFNKLSIEIRSTLKKTMFLTKKNKKILVNLAISGSHNGMLNAAKKTKKLNLKILKKTCIQKTFPIRIY